jgi:Glycosyltransferases involved in cell wall biogenesis
LKPLVSILIPAYNAGEWISEALHSAVAQTWDSKEIIVVDDGSSDETAAIVSRFKSQGVQLLQQSNQGAAAARNSAFSASSGAYIQWLDADDLLSPDKIASQMAFVEQFGTMKTLYSCAFARFLYRHHRAEFIPGALWCDLSPTEWLLRKMAHNLHMAIETWLVSRELAEAAGPWNTKLLVDDDGEYFCRVLLVSDGIVFVPGAKVYCRNTGAQSLSYIGTSSQKLEAQWCSMQAHIAYLQSLEDSARTRAGAVQYIQNWLGYFHPERRDLVEQMQQMAVSLGGTTQVPRIPWKYSWIQRVFGVALARRAQFLLPRMKWAILRAWDKFLFDFQDAGLAARSGRSLPSKLHVRA